MDETSAGPLYATFARRVQALVLDSLVLLATLLFVVCLAAAVQFGQTARVALFLGLVLTVVLYEAVAVSVWGCTIGQRLSNLRVVAPTPNGRLPLWKAFLRWLLKGLTGLASFATMGGTQRNQALHDLPFRTTVEIADPRQARDHHFVRERPSWALAELPSRLRRVLVIAGYLVLLIVLLIALTVIVASPECVDAGRCASGERRLLQIVETGWLAASIAAVLFGWQGRLPGARRRVRISREPSTGPSTAA
jgi:RDD family protein